MGIEARTLHYVCTPQEARALVEEHSEFWVCNCGCRESRGGCSRSRIELCLQFKSHTAADGSGLRPISRAEVEEILSEASAKKLVSRPFRDEATRTVSEGICFCCDDCCGYFLNREERCDPGSSVERTDLDLCNDCLACLPDCHFGAREEREGRLVLHRENCYGCGLCVEACPSQGISMVRR